MNLLKILKKDFNELTILWKAWLFVGLISVLFVTFYNFDTFAVKSIIELIAGLSGVTYVLYTANDKKSSMIFGIIMVLSYGFTALFNGVYGDASQNLLYQFPVLLYGLLSFNNGSDRYMFKYLKKIDIRVIIVIWCALWIGYSIFLQKIGDISPQLDSFTTVTSMFAIMLLAMRSKYQWYLWILVNAVSIWIWYSIGGLSVMSIMWLFYLLNSFIGFYKNIIKK